MSWAAAMGGFASAGLGLGLLRCRGFKGWFEPCAAGKGGAVGPCIFLWDS